MSLTLLIRAPWFGALALLVPDPVSAQAFTTPGGLDVELLDISVENLEVRMRFVAPDLGSEANPAEAVAAEMPWICDNQIAPAIVANGIGDTHVTVSIAQSPIPFGEFDPDIVQIFDFYRVEDGICLWELYPPLGDDEIDEPEPDLGTDMSEAD